MDYELEISFPSYFGADINHIDRIREYELLKLRKYLGEPVDDLLLAVTDYFITASTPKTFNPYDERCVLVQNDKQHEDLCNGIEESGLNVRDATVFEFYSKVQYLEKRSRQNANK